jgi:hypothetical protein
MDAAHGARRDGEKKMTAENKKSFVEFLAKKGDYIDRAGLGFKAFADLDGTEARRFLESLGFTVTNNVDIGHNGIAVTACGIRLSTNGYCFRPA